MNRVMAHYNWKNRCLTRSINRTPSLDCSLAPPPQPTGLSRVTAARPAQASNRPFSPMYSTHQRLESDTVGLLFADVSLITRLAIQVSSPSTTDDNGKHLLIFCIPPTINCTAVSMENTLINKPGLDGQLSTIVRILWSLHGSNEGCGKTHEIATSYPEKMCKVMPASTTSPASPMPPTAVLPAAPTQPQPAPIQPPPSGQTQPSMYLGICEDEKCHQAQAWHV